MRERLAAFVDVLAFIVWNVGLIAWRYTQADTPAVRCEHTQLVGGMVAGENPSTGLEGGPA